MAKYCVVVADSARARLFSLEDAAIGEPGPNLIERSDLSNPEAEAAGKEVWSDYKSGRNLSTAGGGAHGYDDHRNKHRDEIEFRFAKQVAAEVVSLLEAESSYKLVLAAEAHMLGHMRNALGNLNGVSVNEIAKNLAKLPPHELHAHLSQAHILPERRAS